MERDSSTDQATEGAGESSAQRAPSLQRAEAGGASSADGTQGPGGTFVLKNIVEPGQGPSPSTGALAPIREEDVSCQASEGADKVPSDLHQPDSPAIAAGYSGVPPVSWQSANGEKVGLGIHVGRDSCVPHHLAQGTAIHVLLQIRSLWVEKSLVYPPLVWSAAGCGPGAAMGRASLRGAGGPGVTATSHAEQLEAPQKAANGAMLWAAACTRRIFRN